MIFTAPPGLGTVTTMTGNISSCAMTNQTTPHTTAPIPGMLLARMAVETELRASSLQKPFPKTAYAMIVTGNPICQIVKSQADVCKPAPSSPVVRMRPER